MDLSIIETLGWRDAVVAVVAAIAIYMLVAILRLARLKRPAPGPVLPPLKESVKRTEPEAPPPEPPLLPPVPPPPPSQAFGDELQRVTLAAELQTLRGDLAHVRDEVGALRREIDSLRQEMEAMQAARRVSPHYGEAVGLAQRGLDPRDIAERCGISVGEAELVVALSRQDAQGENDKNSE